MNDIIGPPNTYDFGFEFSYASWNEDTQLTLTNVPWNADYRDVVRFTSRGQFDAWINRQPNLILPNTSLQKFEQDVMIDVPLNRAMQYNYLRAVNGASPVGDINKSFYYFVTNVEFVAGNTTKLSLQLDIWQTFGYDILFGNSFIERGHIGIANAKAFDHYGRDYLTTPEGLDLGGEYRVVHVENEVIGNLDGTIGQQFDILVCSTLDLTADPGTVDDPHIKSASGSIFQGVPSAANFYLFRTPSMFAAWLAVYAEKPWVTQSIISVTMIPSPSRYIPGFNYGTNLGDAFLEWYAVNSGGSSDVPGIRTTAKAPNWRGQSWVASVLGDKYDGLLKFLTFPYMTIEVTAWNGSPLTLKPEAWQDNDATIRETASFMPPGQRIAIMPKSYNKDAITGTANASDMDDLGESLNIAKFIDNFPTLPVVNNMALGYLASNRNGIAFSFTNNDWSQQKAQYARQAAINNANAGITNTAAQTGFANSADTANAALGALQNQQNAQWSAVAGVLSPMNIASNTADLVNSIHSGATSIQQTQNSTNARASGTQADIAAQGSIRDTNAAYADAALVGDYQNGIQGIQAKIQDANLIQPSVNGQFGGDAFNLVHGKFGYSLRWKMIDKAAVQRIGNYWLRYGYAVEQFPPIPSNFMCMSKFTYWKLKETYISQGPFPEKFRQAIRGIFEKGVTVWAQPEYIGQTALDDNVPTGGISL